MQSVGQQLRAARLQLGLTLEDISAKCRVPVRTLKAIENDEVSSFDSPFFFKSFVRQFAEQVDLEYGGIEAAVQVQASTLPEPAIPGRGAGYSPGKPTFRVPRPRRFRWMVSFASLAAVVVGGSAFYDFWQNASQTRPGVTAKPAAMVSEADRTSNPAIFGQQKYRIEISALERTWLSMVADGRQIFRGVLEPEDKKVLEGRQIARIDTLNLGAISLVFNGRAIGTVGENGKERSVVFTKDHYKILDAPALNSFIRIVKSNERPAGTLMGLPPDRPFVAVVCCAPSV